MGWRLRISMKKEEARRAVLSEYDGWAKEHPNAAKHDGRLSVLPILTARKVGPSRFPCGWQQVANRSRLASRSVERSASVQNSTILRYPILHARGAKFSGSVRAQPPGKFAVKF